MPFRFLRWLAVSCAGIAIIGSTSLSTIAASRVVAFLPENGEWAEVGYVMRSAYHAAIQSNGSELPFELIIEDCSDLKSLPIVLSKYAGDPEVVAFIGGMPSSATSLIATCAEEAGIPHLIDCNTADSLTFTYRKFVFRLIPPISDFNDGTISWAATVAGRGRLAAVVYDRGTRFSGFIGDIERDLALHWEGDKAWFPYEHGTQDFKVQIDLLTNSKPALVWLFGSTLDVARFLRQCRQADYIPYAFIVGMTELGDGRLISASEGAAEYVIAPRVWIADRSQPEVKKFCESFEAKYLETPDFRAAACYSGIQILSSLLGNPTIIGREQLRLELSEQQFITVFGKIQFESYSKFYHQNRTATFAQQQVGESWLTIWPQENAITDDVYPVPDWRERNRKPIKNISPRRIFILLNSLILLFVAYLVYNGYRRRTEQK